MSGKWILGINPGFGGFNYHDPAAAIVCDGRVVNAAEEERFRRVKGAPGEFPSHAIAWCLQDAKIKISDVEEVAVGYSPLRWTERLPIESARALHRSGMWALIERVASGKSAGRSQAVQSITQTIAELSEILVRASAWESEQTAARRIQGMFLESKAVVPVGFVEHHLAHAASAFYPSGLSAATVIVVDGVGEVTSASSWLMTVDEAKLVEEVKVPNSLGYFYAAITDFLGFRAWEDEGKVMAMAPYGRSDPHVARGLSRVAGKGPAGFDVTGLVMPNMGMGLSLDLQRTRAALSAAFECAPRKPDQPVLPSHHNIAWAAQDFLEGAVSTFVQRAVGLTGVPDVCAAGGVFLNCKLNCFLRNHAGVKQFYVQPVAKDSGLALGAAWMRAVLGYGAAPEEIRLNSLALGPWVTDAEIEEVLLESGLRYTRPEGLTDVVAEALTRGKIVLWYAGRAEFGPRALGHRSILADPRDARMAQRVNEIIKHREPWRPFAPSVLEEWAPKIFEDYDASQPARFMIEAYRVRQEWVAKIPAVVHAADHTARPQTVNRRYEPIFYELVENFWKQTGVPVVLNTSLNDKGDPIAHQPRDALRLFYASGADLLVLESYVISKDASQ